MEEKYKKAIVAGLICGVILVVLTFISTVGVRLAFGNELQNWINLYSNQYYNPPGVMPEIPSGVVLSGVISLVLVALGALTFFGAGVLAAMMAAPFLKTRNDVMVSGAIAGAVAEVIHRPCAMVLSAIMDIVRPITVGGSASSAMSTAIGTFISQLVCCFPVILIAGIILAVVGALIYGMLKLKL